MGARPCLDHDQHPIAPRLSSVRAAVSHSLLVLCVGFDTSGERRLDPVVQVLG
jgi:hypothetical protein